MIDSVTLFVLLWIAFFGFAIFMATKMRNGE